MSDLSTVLIPLGGRYGAGLFAIVDAEDFEKYGHLKWYVHQRGYVVHSDHCHGKTQTLKLHRLVVGAERGQLVDHRDLNKLNNVRGNLRIVTPSGNCCNQNKRPGATSNFKGVRWHKDRQKWQAAIAIGRRFYYLGLFTDEIAAAKAYDVAAIRLHGECARLNFE